MKVSYQFENSILSFNFILEKNHGDRDIYKIGKRTIKLNQTKVIFIMPYLFEINKIHPDLLGLVAILLIYPYVGKRIELSFEISQYLANAFSKCGKIIVPINPSITKRTINNDSVPSIAYSGGTDSTAGLIVMPKNTQVCFLDRIIPINKKSIYCKDNIYLTLDLLINNDYSVNIIQSDMEYLRDPVGFPIDIGCGIANILLADTLNIDSIAYGYANHHKEFLNNNTIDYICTGTFKLYRKDQDIDIEKRYSYWNQLYQSVDLYITMPIMGINEIMTQKIVLSTCYSNIIQSCMRGKIGVECGKCIKCFKTNIVKHIYHHKNIGFKDLNNYLKCIEREIEKKYNIKLENIDGILTLESIFLLIMVYYNNDKPHPIVEKFKTIYPEYNEKNILFQWNETSSFFIMPKYKNTITQNLINLTNLGFS